MFKRVALTFGGSSFEIFAGRDLSDVYATISELAQALEVQPATLRAQLSGSLTKLPDLTAWLTNRAEGDDYNTTPTSANGKTFFAPSSSWKMLLKDRIPSDIWPPSSRPSSRPKKDLGIKIWRRQHSREPVPSSMKTTARSTVTKTTILPRVTAAVTKKTKLRCPATLRPGFSPIPSFLISSSSSLTTTTPNRTRSKLSFFSQPLPSRKHYIKQQVASASPFSAETREPTEHFLSHE